MNRYLSIPLAITIVGFSIAYMSRSSLGEPVAPPSKPAIATNEASIAVAAPNALTKSKMKSNPKAPKVKPMTYEDVQVQVLDGWPTLRVNHFSSRVRVFEPLYATMGQLAQVDADGKPDPDAEAYFCSLSIKAHPLKRDKAQNVFEKLHGIHGAANSGHFAIHVDRYTKEMNVFADGKWQDYKSWQKIALSRYSKLTGWNQDAPGKNSLAP